MMVAGAISGPTIWTPDDLLSALLYFILGQVGWTCVSACVAAVVWCAVPIHLLMIPHRR